MACQQTMTTKHKQTWYRKKIEYSGLKCMKQLMCIIWPVFAANTTRTPIIWLTLGHYSPIIPRQLCLQRTSNKPYNKQLINLKCSVYGKISNLGIAASLEGTKKILIRGGPALRSDPLPFYVPFLAEKTLLYTFHWQMIPFCLPSIGK